jgi:hypothetical protein
LILQQIPDYADGSARYKQANVRSCIQPRH